MWEGKEEEEKAQGKGLREKVHIHDGGPLYESGVMFGVVAKVILLNGL